MDGEVRIMMAPSAFGMGFDKPGIRFVVHGQMPSSLHAYCQEAGCVGRDDGQARCNLLLHAKDRSVQQSFLAGKYLQLEDLDAVHRQLVAEPRNARGWTVQRLLGAPARPGARMQAGVSEPKQEQVLRADRRGRLSARAPDAASTGFSADLSAVLEAYSLGGGTACCETRPTGSGQSRVEETAPANS